jgi:methionine-rich copper-binding protein CopC/protocatechuate 3,4-dioxygenase beta subunit
MSKPVNKGNRIHSSRSGRRNRKAKAAKSLHHGSKLRLEQLEDRVVPSTTHAKQLAIPHPEVPLGLGGQYTQMSEDAHGVLQHSTQPGKYTPGSTTHPTTMADLEAYLQKLKTKFDKMPKPAGHPIPGPLTNQQFVSGAMGTDDPKQERLGNYSPNIHDPLNLIKAMKENPHLRGFSQPPVGPSIVNGFDGMNFLDSVNGYVPPDTDIAVGPQFVVETVNAQIQIYDKATGTPQLPNTPLNQFFNAPSESPFDPVVTYDDITGRFVIAAPTFGNNLLLAASKDSNPLDGFTTYDLTNVNEGGFFLDYPKIGFNKDEVVLTFNMYPGPGSFHVAILAFNAGTLFSNPASLTLGTDYFENDRYSGSTGTQDFTMAAASMHGATSGMPMYFVQENGYANGSQMEVTAASNLLSGSPSYTDTAVGVDAYSSPPSAVQPGYYVATNDTRMLNAEWRDGHLVADQNIGEYWFDNNSHARWYEFNVSGTPYLEQDGTIAPGGDTSTYFPVITIAPGDIIGFAYNESSSTEYPSVYDTGRTSADATGTMETPALAHAGTATYFDFAFRWGDFSGIGVDPNDGSLWSGMEYSTATLSGYPANWATWISHWTIAPVVVSSSPAAGSVVTGAAPTSFSLTFSEAIDPGSINPASFTVNGASADSASLSPDGLTITYTYNSSPVTTQGAESMSLPAGAVTSGGVGNAAFSANFYYVQVQLAVSATSPAVGSVLTAPVTDLVVQFNKDFDPYSVMASEFQVSQGSVASVKILTSSVVDLTLSGVTQDGTLTLNVPSNGGLVDKYGVTNLSFSGTYIIQVNQQPYPVPLVGKDTQGFLIYDPSVTGAINFAGDTDTYTLGLAAGQQISLVLNVDPSLQGTITLVDPNGNTVGSATSAAAGVAAVLNNAPVSKSGTYKLVVSGASGSGNYTLQAILNADYKQVGDSIHTIGTALDLTSAFVSLNTVPASDRAGVLGTVDGAGDNDFYKFYLNAGQSATIASYGLGPPQPVQLEDASGNVLALPDVTGNIDGLVENFYAPASGWYYAVIQGSATAGQLYDMIVTRGADAGTHGNSFNNAQPLDGVNVVLGSITKGTGGLFTLDDQLFVNANPIWPTDPLTGAFIPPNIYAPGSPLNNPFGENMAFDGTDLYYQDGAFSGNGELYKIDPTTGAVLQTASLSPSFTGLAYLNGKLYAAAGFDPNIYIYDATTFAFLGTITDGISDSAVTGLCGDPDRGVLWAVGQSGFQNGRLYEIDPTTGNVLKEGNSQSQAYDQDMAYANGNLYVSDALFFGSGGGQLDVYDPNTFNLITRLPVATQGYVAGLAGDGIGGQTRDWYQFNVNAGDNLVITTTTPGGTTANGLEFENNLNPTINLYDAAGNLVATATGNASDGRNDVINWTALSSGSYRVQIQGATKDSLGEYTISIQGATGGQDPFTVTSTSPVQNGSDINYQPSQITVSFNDSILLTSLSTSNLTIDGLNATSYTVVDNQDVIYYLPAISDRTHNVSISGVTDVHGVSLTPDNFSFITDTDQPYIVSSSLQDGSVFTGAPQTIQEVVTFDEAMNTSLTPSIDLFGEARGVHYNAATSWDSTGTILTITYSNLPTDAYQFNLYASGFQDPAGNTLQSGLTINFDIVAGTSDLTGLTPINPLSSLVYHSTTDNVLVDGNDTDTYNLSIDPQQTLGVIVRPVTSGMTATVNLYSPSGNLIGTATSPTPGAPAVLPAVQSSKGGTYQFTVTGGPGEYTIEPILNALVDPEPFGGTPHNSIATALPIDPYANRFIGHNDRTAVLGTLPGSASVGPDPYGYEGVPVTPTFTDISSDPNATAVLQGTDDSAQYVPFSGLIDPTTGNTFSFSMYGQTYSASEDSLHNHMYLNTDGWMTFEYAENGYFYGGDLKSYPTSAAIAPMWSDTIFIGNGAVYYEVVDPSGTDPQLIIEWKNTQAFYYPGQGFTFEVVLDQNSGHVQFNYASIAYGTPYDNGALSGVGIKGFGYGTPNELTVSYKAGPNAFINSNQSTLIGVGVAHSAPEFYSFALNQGQSATIALQSLDNQNVAFSLFDENGNLLADGSPGATNYTAGLNNFVAPADGTYYVEVTGKSTAHFNLVVTRGADFTTQDHTTLATAQDITATEGSGDSKMGGALGYLVNPSGAVVGSTYEGIDFNGSNCGCLPPDPNAAAGGNYIIEMVNIQIRIYDKTNGNILLDEPINTFFGPLGVPTAGDPYVLYDTIANRWYVTAIDGSDNSQIELAVSNDANPLDGFNHQFLVPLAASGTLADFPKYGYNADALVMEGNQFGDGHSVVTTIDKHDLLTGALVYYQSTPSFNFRALVPAQMHGAKPGDPMWFMASTGDPTYDGTHPTTIRVTRMDSVLSSSPTYTDYAVNVNQYGPNTGFADQPGAAGSVATNDVSTTQVDYLNGSLVTAFSASTPADGFTVSKTHWYQVDVSSGTPTLVQEGLVDPGPGVWTFFPSATQDPLGNIGITYMESSSSEFVSAYVAGHIAGSPLGSTTAGNAFAPGTELEQVSFRNGDYSTVVYDSTTGLFWAANEYAGTNSGSDIWHTRIASFSVLSSIGTDYYSVNTNAGDNLHFATSTPAGGPGEFINNFYPELLLYDPNGNLVAIANGNASDGRNSLIDFTVPDGDAGKWTIEVTASPSTPTPTSGEYGLLATGATGAVSPFAVTSTNPATGALIQPPTDYIATFSQTVLASSLTPGELTINGVPALSVTYVDAHTVDWKIDPSSIPNGERVQNTAVISADSSGNRVMDVSGAQLADFTSSFTTDNVAPYVVSSSVNNGDVFSRSPYNLTEVVTFSEPMNTGATTASSFDLHGQFRNQDIAAASFSWDSTGTVLTINYANLPDDDYTLTLFAGGFQDLVGLTMASDFVVNFAVALNSSGECAAFPTPLTAIPPLGDLIYTGSDSHVLVTSTDVNCLTLNLNAGESLTLHGTPTNPGQQLSESVVDPNGNPIGSATAPAAGEDVYLQTVPITTTGTYKIEISDAGGNLGLYTIQAYLNTLLKIGTGNLSIATAIDLTPSSYINGPGNSDRLAILGQLPSDIVTPGSVFVSSRYYGFYNSAPTPSDVLRLNAQGQIAKVIPVSNDPYLSLSGVELDPANNMLYAAVTTSFNGYGGPGSGSVNGDLLEFDPVTGAQVATITLPVDNSNYFWYYPYGFQIASDGTFWITQPNSQNIIHLDANYNEVASYSVSGMVPESVTLGTDGNLYIGALNGPNGNGIYQLNPNTGSVSYFYNSPFPQLNSLVPGGASIWSGDFYNGGLRFDYNANTLQNVGFYGTTQVQNDIYGNEWNTNFAYYDVFKFDPSGNEQFGEFVPGPIGVTTWGADNSNPPPQDTQDYYSFSLSAGQSATLAVEALNGKAVHITLVDGSGNVLATGVSGSTNVSEYIQNFVASTDGTFYAEVTGDLGVKYSLTVTRAANFDIEPHNSIYTAQPLTGTNGVLGALDPGGKLVIGQQIEGIDFNGSNCGCLPPDTDAAVGGNYIMENVNVQVRVYDKTSGSILLDEPLATFFGASSGGDPYVVYDDVANRWYDEGLDSSDGGFFLNVSNDSNPLDGFTTYHLSSGLGGPITDYPKMGFNKDAIFISYNNFGSGGSAATVISIDKSAALSGTLSYFVSTPPAFQFRAMPPAQMHGDTTGGVEWFVSTDGTDAGGNTIRVTELTNYLSNSPTYTLTSLPVAQYQQALTANQPGGTWTTFPNTTTTEVQYRDGKLVTAMASAIAVDGFTFPKGLYYEIDVSSGTPTLVLQGVIDPGSGVAVQMPSVALDTKGNLGFTWMEGSSSEYVSMWVGALDTSGHFSSYDAAPGGGFFYANFRIGDYSTTVVDPTDGTTFWSANEYIGGDGASDIWRTHITSFSLPPAVNDDWYSVNVAAGNSLSLTSSTPSDQGGQFPNTASLEIELYDTFGNLVAVGTKLGDGRNEALFYNAPITGTYSIHVYNDPGTPGEYYLEVDTPQYQAGDISGTVYNDLNGSGAIQPGDPGLDNWEIDVFDSNNNFVAAQLSHNGGQFDIGGLAPGTYTVSEIQMSGWTETQPVGNSYTITVTSGSTASGNNFGNFKDIVISGMKFNDLTGIGAFMPGDPGLPGWTIDLLNASGAIVGSTVTDANGNYSFADVGPGTYTVQEELQPGWIQTFPAPPGTYTFTATSGGDVSGDDFGNFQLVTFSGEVYNDLNGSGSFQPGDPGLPGWTVNLYDAMGNLVATTTSDNAGSYSFANLGPGQYTISEVHQNGWYQTDPVDPPGTYTLQAISSSNPSSLDFGNFQLVNVYGEVYNDLNGNGNLDNGEPGLPGWTVTLYDPSGNVVATTVSDANGNYTFSNLFPATFTLSETLQNGWIQTEPVNPNYYQFTTQSGTNETGLNFGNFNNAPSSISGVVFNDKNDNHTQDSGEPGLAGVTVYLGAQSTTTDANGNFAFSNLAPGTYALSEKVPAGYMETYPYGNSINITTTGGMNITQDIANAVPYLSVDAKVGGPGYHESGAGWYSVNTGWNDGKSRQHDASSKAAAANWTFSKHGGLPIAKYEVYVEWNPSASLSPSTTYKVYDGSNLLNTVTLNQQNAPYGGVFQSFGWYSLGYYSVHHSRIDVVMSDSSAGGVNADGVLILQAGSATSAPDGIVPGAPGALGSRVIVGTTAGSVQQVVSALSSGAPAGINPPGPIAGDWAAGPSGMLGGLPPVISTDKQSHVISAVDAAFATTNQPSGDDPGDIIGLTAWARVTGKPIV